MPLADVLQAALSRPMARVLRGPVQDLMETILEDHGYAHPEQVQGLQDQLNEAEAQLSSQEEEIRALEAQALSLKQRLEARKER